MGAHAIATLLSVLATQGSVAPPQPNLSGDWVIVTATNSTRGGNSDDQSPTKSHTISGAAFNCGRECRLVQKGSALTIERAQIDGGDGSSTPAVTLQLDAQLQTVSDSVNPGNTIQTVSQWEDGKVVITSTTYGRLFAKQTISYDQTGLTVTTSSFVAGWTLTLRYTKKAPTTR
jgi:hypothetical protein